MSSVLLNLLNNSKELLEQDLDSDNPSWIIELGFQIVLLSICLDKLDKTETSTNLDSINKNLLRIWGDYIRYLIEKNGSFDERYKYYFMRNGLLAENKEFKEPEEPKEVVPRKLRRRTRRVTR